MWEKYIILLICFITMTCAKREDYRNSGEEIEDRIVSFKKNGPYLPTVHSRTIKGDSAVVEKFVQTLMSSERYLKMIEAVDRKLDHLDGTFHERTNSILKYLGEMRNMETTPVNRLEGTLMALKQVLDQLKETMVNRLDIPHMRVDPEYHVDSGLDSRLTFLENNVKNIMAGVDSIVATISEVKSRQYTKTMTKQDGGTNVETLVNEFRRTLHEQKSKKCECKGGRVDRSERYPTDCHEIQMQGFNVSGIYKIKPDDMDPFYVLCDLTTAGGGWTVFQNRFDGSQDFYKSWADYAHGFGNLAGEFWLGLEKLSYLTNQKLYELRIEMETQHGQEAYAGYSVFTVGPEHEGYRISTLGTFYGSAGDSLSYHAGQKFSTVDTDNDEWKDGACSQEHGGAWWYKECDKSNLNGKYSMTTDEHQGQSIYWISFKGPKSPLTKTKMMIRPLPASKPLDFRNSNQRKIIEISKVRPNQNKMKGVHMKKVNQRLSSYDLSQSRSLYKYEEPTQAEIFYPTY